MDTAARRFRLGRGATANDGKTFCFVHRFVTLGLRRQVTEWLVLLDKAIRLDRHFDELAPLQKNSLAINDWSGS
jgi:hypothetical protein